MHTNGAMAKHMPGVEPVPHPWPELHVYCHRRRFRPLTRIEMFAGVSQSLPVPAGDGRVFGVQELGDLQLTQILNLNG